MTISKPLHINTPLLATPLPSVPSVHTENGKTISQSGTMFLKLECLQPPGSFKIRGIGHMCQKAAANGCKIFVSSSGGNAGIATAYAGKQLGIETVVFVPTSTPMSARRKILELGAEVVVKGEVWDEANEAATCFHESHAHSILVHPFDHPDLWAGHSTLIDEALHQMSPATPDLVVCSVGGGGLFCGIVEGLRQHQLHHTPVMAVETLGAHSLSSALASGEPVALPGGITSIAKSLGARTIGETSLRYAQEHPTTSVVVSDRMAVESCIQFLDRHRLLVEPACGAALSLAYTGELGMALEAAGVGMPQDMNVLMVVCGGATITAEELLACHRALNP